MKNASNRAESGGKGCFTRSGKLKRGQGQVSAGKVANDGHAHYHAPAIFNPPPFSHMG